MSTTGGRLSACLLLTALSVAPAFAGVKEAQHQQMVGLAQQIERIEALGRAHSASYAALAAQYRELSRALGGDDPGAQLDLQPTDGRGEAPEGTIGTVPPPPPNCALGVTSAVNNTPVAIPSTAPPVVVSSTINVAGAGTILWDVNLTTFITHTFSADLDITLQSPAGTIVTVTTDNGGGNDNVYNGTLWDDDANPAGQVPYTSNNGLATDHSYADIVLASPLVPEEAFHAFTGEDPNGTWTLTISDDANLDGGSLNSWSLELATLDQAPVNDTTSFFTQASPVAIPTGPAVVSSTVGVNAVANPICGLTLTTGLTHTNVSDLDITLMSPAGTIVTVTTDNGGTNDNVYNGTLWDDDANPAGQVPYANNNGLVNDQTYVNNTLASPLVVEEALGAFRGENANGTWTLTISDDLASASTGSLNIWTLAFTSCSCAGGGVCTITPPLDIVQSNDPGFCGAVVNYPAPTVSGDCGPVTCAPASGSFFPVGTTNVTCSDPSTGASADFDVTVNDTQPPSVTPPNPVVPNDPGLCSAVVPFAAGAADNCPGVTVGCVPPGGGVFPVGVTPISCTATDAAGNTATAPGSVTVNDVEAPTITCPADIELDLPPASPGQNVDYDPPVAGDNCGVVFGCVPVSGDYFLAGQTPVTCTANDPAGNTAQCTFNVILGAVTVLEVPTVSTLGMLALALLLAAAAFVVLRRHG